MDETEDRPLQQKLVIGMPAYNEEKYIGTILLQIRQYAKHVVVANDGSVDRTSKVAKMAGATVIEHGQNRGYGSAIRTILAEAKRQDADILVILDADGQHDPDYIPSLVEAIRDGADVAIGTRKIQRGNTPPYRRAGQRVLSYFTRALSGSKVSDTESGFRAYSKKALAELEPKESGMAISAEIVMEAARKGLQVKEIPILAIYTKDGSTLNPVRHGMGVLSRIMVMSSERRPLLFFGLGGLLSIVLGVIAGVVVIRILNTQHVLQVGTALISTLFIIVGVVSIFAGVILNTLTKRTGEFREISE